MRINYRELELAFYSFNDMDELQPGAAYYNIKKCLIEYKGSDEFQKPVNYKVRKEHIKIPRESDFDQLFWTLKYFRRDGIEYHDQLSAAFGRGNYSKLKNILHRLDMLDNYHDYINNKIKDLLYDWALMNEIEIEN